MMPETLEQENLGLRQENARLRAMVDEIRSALSEPEEIIRAIRNGEVDAVVVQEKGEAEIYSLQRFDSAYRTVVEQCFPYGVWLAKPKGQPLYVSPSFLDLVQTDLDQMRAKGQFHFLPPEIRHEVDHAWSRSLDSGEEFNVEYPIRLADGSERTIWTQGILTHTHDGYPHWVGVNIDITERKRFKDELREQAEALVESETSFRQLADAMPQIVWVARPDGFHEYFNQKWHDYTGRSPETCLGHSWCDLLHPDDSQRALDLWNRALQSGEPYEIEYRFRGNGGDYRWFLGRALPVRDRAGRVTRWFGTCTDIDDAKRLQEELRNVAARLSEADRRKDEFLAMLAHELRNPLAPIRTGLELMKMTHGDASVIEELRSMMERQTEQLVTLVGDLLEVSRITRGKLELRRQRIRLEDVVLSALEACKSNIDDARHELTTRLPEEPVYIDADPYRLAQVFSNLLNNAAKYTPPGGRIQIEAERQEGEVLITVADNGVGIPADKQEHIFEMFTQIDTTAEQGYSGLGIGLTLARSLVEMHGGTIQVRSGGRDQGSEFIVCLPVAVDPPLPGTAPAGTDGTNSTTGLRVLIIDDNRVAADMLSLVVQRMGNQVRTAYEGQAGIQAAAEFLPDVVLMDLGMPNINGYQAARHIRQQPWGASMMLVALTGWGQEEDKRRSKEAGFDDHLVKPAEASVLQALFAAAEQRIASR